VIGVAIKLVEYLWRKWRVALCVVAAIVALWIVHGHLVNLAFNRAFNAGWQQQHDALMKLQSDYRGAQGIARANNLEAVRKVEADTTKISEDKQHEIEAQLASARALADAYLKRLRGASGDTQGHSGQTGLSEATSSPGDPVGTNRVPVVDAGDVQVCTKNTVVALGYQRFYGEVRARYDALTQ